jgi:hypothetical protein
MIIAFFQSHTWFVRDERAVSYLRVVHWHPRSQANQRWLAASAGGSQTPAAPPHALASPSSGWNPGEQHKRARKSKSHITLIFT